MVNTIGYLGGSLLVKLGSAEYVQSFFECVEELDFDEPVRSKIGDRLYRKYLKLDDLECACEAMGLVKNVFERTKLSEVLNSSYVSELKAEGRGDEILYSIYANFFSGFEDVVESSRYFYEDWGQYKRVFIGRVDVPHYDMYKRIPDSVLEQVSDKPVWLRAVVGDDVPEFN
jgi:hypothetical protein